MITKEQQSAIGRRSRRKGASFQNLIARMLTEAWGIPILSTPQSGGLSMKGDLCVGGNPPAHVLSYSIECKNKKSLSIPVIIRNPDVVPIADEQIVFFKEHGYKDVWLAFDVRKGPSGVAPVGIDHPPPFLRIMRIDGRLLGVMKIDGPYLKERRRSFVTPIYRPPKKDTDPEA